MNYDKIVYEALFEVFSQRLPAGLSASGFATSAMEEVRRAYGESHRRYHNLDHIGEMITDADLLRHNRSIDLSDVEWQQLVMAIIYHDFIYDPTLPAGANENGSAFHAALSMQGWNRTAGTQVFDAAFQKRVMLLINMTVTHIVPDDGDVVAQLLCDADLLRFAAPYPAFEKNNGDIRTEYNHVSDEDWQNGRGAVMLHYLLRDPFFYIATDRTNTATLNIVRHMRELNHG